MAETIDFNGLNHAKALKKKTEKYFLLNYVRDNIRWRRISHTIRNFIVRWMEYKIMEENLCPITMKILIIEKFLALIRIDLLYVKRFTCCYVFQGMLDYVM